MRIGRRQLGRRQLVQAMLALPCLAGPSRAATFTDWMQSISVASAFIKAGIPARSYSMSSVSMLPTLAVKDVVLVDLRLAGQQPARGDIIVFRLDNDPNTVWLKRVIGVPGDRVAFHRGRLVLNGAEVSSEPAGTFEGEAISGQTTFDQFTETLPGAAPYNIVRFRKGGGYLEDAPEKLVEPGFLYVVGDNRDNSMDSRADTMKPVTISNVVGRVVYRERPNAGWLVPRDSVPDLPSE